MMILLQKEIERIIAQAPSRNSCGPDNIRKYGSTLYVEMAWNKMAQTPPMHTLIFNCM